MSEPLTAAGAYLVRDLTREPGVYSDETARRLVSDVEAEAAARAVDEALLVEAVAEALMVALRREDHPRGYVPRTGVMYDSLAAALVAHLRGPRPEGEG